MSASTRRARPYRLLRLALCAGLVTGAMAAAGSVAAGASAPPAGFLASRTDDLYSHERRLMAAIDPATASGLFERVAATPRVSGTEGARRTADWLEERLTGWGWRVERRSYRVYLPHAVSVSVERTTPAPRRLAAEPPEGSEPGADSYPPVAGYSAAGDVEAPVVYANRGSRTDFRQLAEAGVEVAGRIVLVRYGEGFRGAKVAEAERAGAAAVILFSDPVDDGFGRGEVLPAGPFRPASGLERGSVKVAAPGDPTTPGWASSEGARRTAPDEAGAGTPRIPVVAIGYGAARELLEPLAGAAAPRTWQGGLPIVYRYGGSVAARARVVVELDDRPYKTITNVLAWRIGAVRPEQVVVAGAHYDSWTAGAVDNASGTVSLLLTARAFARLRQFGIEPARSVMLGFWDAEEWGLIGSTEYVEERAGLLDAELVAYLNQDGVAGGPYFAASASPSLARLLRDVTRVVPDPVVPAASVYDEWIRRAESTGRSASLTPPAAGSDDAPFFAHLGVPTASYGFQGASGVYHSVHDDADFMRRFGDPDFAQHVAAARITALAAWRLADADLLPLDYADYGRVMLGHARALPDFASIEGERRRLIRAAERFGAAATRLEATAGAALAAFRPAESLLEKANRGLMAVERTLTRSQGLPGRPWHRNVVFAPDAEDAYRVVVFPAVAQALADRDPSYLRAELRDLAERIERAAAELERASATVGVTGPVRLGSP